MSFPTPPTPRRPVRPNFPLRRTKEILLATETDLDSDGKPRALEADEVIAIANEIAQLDRDIIQVKADKAQDEADWLKYYNAVKEWEREQQELGQLLGDKEEMQRLARLGYEERKKAAAMKRNETARKRSFRKAGRMLSLLGFGLALLAMLKDNRLSFVFMAPIP